ncbi:MAG: beta-galactosidase [Eubacteriales bacterium]|nr:beta-galactosidase [Eubacteriales bacterium]
MMTYMPELRELNGQKVLYVDNQPFLILGFQLNCDSCYDPDVIDKLMRNARAMGCNTVALLLYWRLIEPQESVFDYSILDSMLQSANKHDLRIVLVWFGSYKNATMHYAPDWIINDHETYRRVHAANGDEIPYVACYNCGELIEKDKRAVTNVFAHLRDKDTTQRVILFQVNNETGLLGGTSRCHCPVCEERYHEKDYPALYGQRADEAFSAECLLAFQEQIAESAKAVYPLPCYMNAWLAFPTPDSIGGFTYPAGGPNYRVLDVYVEQKKYIDFVSPDIYVPSYRDFHRVCRDYKRLGNPLYVAEHALGSTSRAYKNVYYAFGEFASLGFDPWAIDCAYPDVMEKPLCDVVHERWNDEAYEMLSSYRPIREAMIPVAKAMGTDRLKYWVQEESETDLALDFGDVFVKVSYCKPKNGQSRGMAIRLSTNQFVVLGCNSMVGFLREDGSVIEMSRSERGHFDGETFIKEGENTIMGQDHGKHRLLIREGKVHFIELNVEGKLPDSRTDIMKMVEI